MLSHQKILSRMLCHGIKRNDEMLNKDDGSGVVQRRGIIQKYPGIELIGLGMDWICKTRDE